MKKTFVLIALVFAAVFTAVGQDQLDNVVKGNLPDANYLASGYISPFLKTFATGLNQGWYNTAKPHKIAGIDITVSVAAIAIPDSEKLFEVDNTRLTSVSLVTTHTGASVSATGKGSVPTVFGPDRAPRYQYDNPLVIPNQFDGPPGVNLSEEYGINRMPVPVANVGIGLPKGTELKVRYIPTLNLGDNTTLDMIGFAVMHDVKQWIPGIKNLPFDLSGLIGYTKLSLETQFDRPDQKGIFEMTGTTVQGIISKKLAVLTVYGGLGYNIARANLALKGNYDINPLPSSTDYESKDPISVEASASGPRMTAGMRLKLAILTIHADYTLQKQNALTIGVGLSVR